MTSTGRPAAAGNGATAGGPAAVGPDLLRELVKEVLAEVLGRPGHPVGGAGSPAALADSAGSQAALAGSAGSPAALAGGEPDRPVSRAAPPDSVPPGEPLLPVRPGVPAPAGPDRPAPAGRGRPAPADEAGSWTVRISTDEELHQFVLRVLRLADNAKLRRDLISGRVRFRLASGAARGHAEHRVDKGAVTERVVAAAAQAGARLVLGRRAVLTPLAKDRARALGVAISRER